MPNQKQSDSSDNNKSNTTSTNANQVSPAPQAPFIEQLYDKVHEVLGGTNPRQAFVLSLPGQPLDMHTYEYDVDDVKPAVVAIKESQLANNLYDVAKSVGGNNGLLLSEQYRSALNALSPKMNKTVLEAKEQLRKLLNAPYTYDFGDGPQVSTLQKVFHFLYKQWVTSRETWSRIKKEKRDLLKEQFPASGQGDLRRNEYIEWYQSNAEVYLSDIEQRHSAILAVFSINDMRILEGVLDNGPGAELQEARNVLNHAGMPNPDGGKTYPVQLSPEKWFERLDTSFKYEDLLGSVEFQTDKLRSMYKQQNRLAETIRRLESMSSSSEEIEAAQKKKNDSELELMNSMKSVTEVQTQNTLELTRFIVQTVSKTNTGGVGSVFKNLFGSTVNLDDAKTKEITGKINKVTAAYEDMLKAEQNVLTNAIDLQKKQQLNFSDDVAELQVTLNNLKLDIEETLNNLGVVKMRAQEESENTDVSPNEIPTGYSKVTISTNMSSLSHKESSKESASQSHYGVSFFFGGYSHSSSTTQSAFNSAISSGSSKLDIGMSVTKVSIERPWFNPGVFKLTSNMYNTGGIPISKSSELAPDFNNASSINQGLFPSYPTAFVVARDVTIRFENESSDSNVVTDAVSKSASNGGGFFGFRGSSSSQSSESNKDVSVQTSGKAITIRFATPQVIGYYLSLVEKDLSILDAKADAKDKDAMSILQFATECRAILAANEQNPTQ